MLFRSADMTQVMPLPTAGGVQQVRVFSLRGAHLLGMLANTDKAKAFRRWVLDVLDQDAPPPALIVGMPVGFVNAAQSKELLRRNNAFYTMDYHDGAFQFCFEWPDVTRNSCVHA